MINFRKISTVMVIYIAWQYVFGSSTTPPDSFVSSVTFTMDGKLIISGLGISLFRKDVSSGKFSIIEESVDKIFYFPGCKLIDPYDNSFGIKDTEVIFLKVEYHDFANHNVVYDTFFFPISAAYFSRQFLVIRIVRLKRWRKLLRRKTFGESEEGIPFRIIIDTDGFSFVRYDGYP